MDPERWQRIEQLYHSALPLEAGARSAFLREACAGDEELRREVESLLDHYAKAQDFIETPPIQVAAEALARDPLVGEQLGSYRILSLLGSGGMGRVYEAVDSKLDRRVALKVVSSEILSGDEQMKRLVREAKAASALNHPNIATIYELGQADGVHFIAMEYVEGQTLASRIAAGPMGSSQIVEIALQIADALDEAHSKNIIHRDIKPANLMLTSRERIKVLDFGIAKFSKTDSDKSATTYGSNTGLVLGTLDYMSPEQLMGRTLDHRTDIFSLGAVLYELATGRKPFAGAVTSETIDRLLHAQPDAIPRFNYEIQPELARIILKMLAKDPALRYQSAAEIRVDLMRLRVDAPAPARVLPPNKRRLLMVLPLLLAAGTAVIWVSGLLERVPPSERTGTPSLSQSNDARLLERAKVLAAHWSVADNEQAIRFLEEFIQRNPDDAGAQSALALEKLKQFWWYQADSSLLEDVVRSASRALQFDPNLVDAEAVLLITKTLASGDPSLYLHLAQCLKRDPNQAEALGWLAYNFCAKAGEFSVGSRFTKRLERFHADKPYAAFINAFMAIQRGDFAEARKRIHQLQLDFSDSDTAAFLSVTAGIASGNAPLLELAIKEYELLNLNKPSVVIYRTYLQSLKTPATVPENFESDLRTYLETDYEMAGIYAQIKARMSKPDEALKWLEHSINRGNYNIFQVKHIDFKILAGDKRYQALTQSLEKKIKSLATQIEESLPGYP